MLQMVFAGAANLLFTGIAPTELLRTYRLRKAAAMLRRGGYTISEVTYSVGFSTPGYFSKCFREMFGVNPSDF